MVELPCHVLELLLIPVALLPVVPYIPFPAECCNYTSSTLLLVVLAAATWPTSIADNIYVVVDDTGIDVSQDDQPHLMRRRTFTNKCHHGEKYLLALDVVLVTHPPPPLPPPPLLPHSLSITSSTQLLVAWIGKPLSATSTRLHVESESLAQMLYAR